ncbi:cell division protein ZapA [Rhodoferax sediminis]|jgi:cell division protein ZapA|uniref:Cell division protein ZapA n=1 Tax=Rhodoferax sediminis TaxID=2509614 RepID=A0A515DAA8_9BURK|nr:cell division protein ZapA [Rhodoferax sediminis]QDL37341.1 cell division protein ZapA [Rhodoferax sediminis]
MKQLEVQIMGQSYLLGCPEGGESSLLDAVERVDSAMCKIRDAGKVRARDRIAVLAALNLASEFSQQSAAALQASASATPGTTSPGVESAGADPRLDALIERLDSALSVDGQLL